MLEQLEDEYKMHENKKNIYQKDKQYTKNKKRVSFCSNKNRKIVE